MKLILASTSKYRIEQLNKFGAKFTALAPTFNEEDFKQKALPPRKLCAFLAQEKAKSLTQKYPDHIIIGADQLVHLDKKILGKPLSKQNAIKMLKKMSGKTHELITSVCLAHNNRIYTETTVAKIKMRKLTKTEIKNYIERDNPLDTCGAYKLELSGLSLIESLKTDDPSALTGLALLKMQKLFLRAGIKIPFKKSNYV